MYFHFFIFAFVAYIWYYKHKIIAKTTANECFLYALL
jgi:hypothetical protein